MEFLLTDVLIIDYRASTLALLQRIWFHGLPRARQTTLVGRMRDLRVPSWHRNQSNEIEP